MTQQINLLSSDRRSSQALLAVGAVALAVIGMIAYGRDASNETQALRDEAQRSERELAQLRTAVVAAQKAAQPAPGAQPVEVELKELRARAEAARQLMDVARSGAFGSTEGFSRHFRTLSSQAQDDVWLTSVTIGRNGKAMVVAGRGMGSESVVLYTRKLNEAFRPLGLRFNAVEMAPEPPAISFKLS